MDIQTQYFVQLGQNKTNPTFTAYIIANMSQKEIHPPNGENNTKVKLVDVLMLGRYANKYATHELTGINIWTGALYTDDNDPG